MNRSEVEGIAEVLLRKLNIKMIWTIAISLFCIGGAWAGLNYRVNANAGTIETLSIKTAQDHDDIVEIKTDVKYIKDEMSQQRTLLKEIRAKL